MAIQGEGPREHPARRKEIVNAARGIAAEQGWGAVTVRAIAARIGCSAPAIYQYFRDKDAVLAALAAEGEAALSAALDDALADIHGPAKRLRSAVQALWAFAMDNRELFAVMFGLDGLASHATGGAPSALRHVAAELVAKRAKKGEDADAVADRVAATVYGFIGLTLSGNFPGGGERAAELLSQVIEDIIKGLGKH